jgi:CRISPR/Cas system endoribonuclease Cas6 (RAMP superfamily)
MDIIEISDSGMERSLKKDEYQIETQINSDRWEYNPETQIEINKKILITLVSPLRFKALGQYVKQLNETDLAMCFHRRVQVLCSQYGHNDYNNRYSFLGKWGIIKNDLKWRDYIHYSARQKKEMCLGGLVGSFVLEGEFSAYEYSFLQFAEKFHTGKNTNFGLGKLKVTEYDRV